MVSTSILKPSGTSFGWCINQYDGCAHGCRYCYGMTIRRKKYADWINSNSKENVIERLEKDIKKLQSNGAKVNDVFLGSITDSYQPLERELKLTRQVVQVLKEHEMPFTILTKSDLVLRDIDLFKNYKWCRVGVTIVSLDESFRKELEQFSSSIVSRIAALKALKSNDISTYVSCEPVFPVTESDPIAIVKEVRDYVDLFEFGMWNRYRIEGIASRYYEGYTDSYYAAMFKELIEFCDREDINYGIASHSRNFVEKHGLPFRSYPSLKE